MKDLIEREAVLKEFEKGTENLYGRIDKLPSVQPLSVLDDIKAEIRQIVDEETEHDETWSRGLHYALCIIDKHTQ